MSDIILETELDILNIDNFNNYVNIAYNFEKSVIEISSELGKNTKNKYLLDLNKSFINLVYYLMCLDKFNEVNNFFGKTGYFVLTYIYKNPENNNLIDILKSNNYEFIVKSFFSNHISSELSINEDISIQEKYLIPESGQFTHSTRSTTAKIIKLLIIYTYVSYIDNINTIEEIKCNFGKIVYKQTIVMLTNYTFIILLTLFSKLKKNEIEMGDDIYTTFIKKLKNNIREQLAENILDEPLFAYYIEILKIENKKDSSQYIEYITTLNSLNRELINTLRLSLGSFSLVKFDSDPDYSSFEEKFYHNFEETVDIYKDEVLSTMIDYNAMTIQYNPCNLLKSKPASCESDHETAVADDDDEILKQIVDDYDYDVKDIKWLNIIERKFYKISKNLIKIIKE